jgi:hypothetical protein
MRGRYHLQVEDIEMRITLKSILKYIKARHDEAIATFRNCFASCG